MSAYDCEQCRAVAPELALGIASGEERAAALRHLAGCPWCRNDVRDLTETAETLLLAAREVEPSAGFDQRVVAEMAPPSRGWSRRATVLAAAAALVVVLGVGGLVGWFAGRPSDAARDYEAAIEATDGRSLRVADLGLSEDSSRVVVYDGDPSWLLVTIAGGLPDGEYGIVCEYEGGWSINPGTVAVEGGHGTWAATVPRTLADLTSVRLQTADGAEAGNAQLG